MALDSVNYDGKELVGETDIEMDILLDIQGSIKELKQLWNNMGIEGDQRRERITAVKSHLQNILAEMIKEESARKQEIIRRLEDYSKQIDKLCIELNISPSEPAYDKSSPLLLREKELMLELESLENQKQKQLASYKLLRDQEKVLCDILQAMPCTIASQIPSNRELGELKQHIEDLLIEKERRQKEFTSIKQEITRLMEEQQIVPVTQFEQDLVLKENGIILSRGNLAEAYKLKERLESQHHQMQVEFQEMMENLKMLWLILQIPECEQDTFLLQVQVCNPNPNILKQLKNEILKYEKLMLEKMTEAIETLRENIKLWAVKCCLSDLETQQILSSCCNENSEELLTCYSSVFKKLHSFYEENVEIFAKLSKREELWQKMKDLERKESDPSRYQNRGGSLLRQQREYQHVIKAIPRVEHELSILVQKWEARENKDFLVWGQKVEEFIKNQWKDYKVLKENARMERLKQKCLSDSHNTPPFQHKITGILSDRIVLSSPRPNSVRKTPGCSGTPKRQRCDTDRQTRESPLLEVKNGEPMRKRRILAEFKSPNALAQGLGPSTSPALTIESCDSYTRFEKELNNPSRKDARSSCVPTKTSENI